MPVKCFDNPKKYAFRLKSTGECTFSRRHTDEMSKKALASATQGLNETQTFKVAIGNRGHTHEH